MEMAKRFGVGHPTVREALKKLETIGMGMLPEATMFNGKRWDREQNTLFCSIGDKTKLRVLVPLSPAEYELLNANHKKATAQHLREMRRLLNTAGQNLADDDVLNTINMSFHRQIALASGNAVLVQLLDVLRELFTEEQRLILNIFGSRERDHEGHLAILDALERRDATLGVKRMLAHLKGVEDAILRWNPEHHPVR